MEDLLKTVCKPLKDLQATLAQLDFITITENLSTTDLQHIRTAIATGEKKLKSLMKETTVKDKFKNISKEDIVEYIQDILERTKEGLETSLSYNRKFEDIQEVKSLNETIKQTISTSWLSSKNFNTPHLKPLRAVVERSKTLQELRMNCGILAVQIDYYNEQQHLLGLIEELTESIDSLHKTLDERERVITELVGVYNEDMSEHELLKAIEKTKQEHSMSDTQVCRVFGISRTKLNKLRAELNCSLFLTK